MREIKFRGRVPITENWIYGIYIPASCTKLGYHSIIDDWHRREVNPDTVGQYTGMRDINGYVIYEGDIVCRSGEDKPLKVIFDDASFMADDGTTLFHLGDYDWQLIGNIHDNPELLEKKQV